MLSTSVAPGRADLAAAWVPNWSAIVISSTSIPLVLSMRVKYAASHLGRAFVSARPVGLMNSHRNSEGNPKGPVRIQ